jgi:hypothetical protein
VAAHRKALIVATYNYMDTGLRQLKAPAHDAEALAEVLRDRNVAGFDVTVLLDEPPTSSRQTKLLLLVLLAAPGPDGGLCSWVGACWRCPCSL